MTPLAEYISDVNILTFSKVDSLSSYNKLTSSDLLSKLVIYCANSVIPAPPSANPLDSIATESFSSHIFLTNLISSLESPGNKFIATTDCNPYLETIFIALIKFSEPLIIASSFFVINSFKSTPPCHFSPLIVATITAQNGLGPPCLTLISINFSKPKSAPNPASVIT